MFKFRNVSKNTYKNTVFFLVVILAVLIVLLSVCLYAFSAKKITEKIYDVEIQKLNSYEQTISNMESDINIQMTAIVNNPYIKKEYSDLTTEEKMHLAHSFFDTQNLSDYVYSAHIYYADIDKLIARNGTDAGLKTEVIDEYLKKKPIGVRNLYFKRKVEDKNILTVVMGFPFDIANEKGAIIFDLDFDKFFSSATGNNTRNMHLVLDHENNILIDTANIGQQLLDSKEFINLLESNKIKEKNGELRVEHKTYIVNFVVSKWNGFKYISLVNTKELFKEIRSIRNLFSLIAFISILISYLFVKRSFFRLYKPLKRISDLIVPHSSQDTEYDEFGMIENYVTNMLEAQEKVHEYNVRNNRAILWGVIVNICHGYIDDHDEEFIYEQLKNNNWHLENREFLVIVIEFGTKVDNDILAEETFEENQSNDIDMITIFYENKLLGLISHSGDFEKLIKYVSNLHVYFERKLEVNNCIGIGNSYKKLRDCGNSYREALEALQYKKSAENEGIIHINDCVAEELDVKSLLYCEEKEKKIIYAIRNIQKDVMEEIIAELEAKIKENDNDSSHEILRRIMFSTIQSFESMGMKYERVLSDDFLKEHAKYHNAPIGEYLDFIKNCLMTIIQYVEQTRNYSNELKARQIKEYIDENYALPLSREELATIIKVSPAYLTTIFKNYMGMTFKIYITKVRMERAAEMLQTTNLNAAEVGRRVGYDVSRSFYRAFKTYYGVTPDKYKLQ